MTSHVLSFLCGSMVALAICAVYFFYLEQKNKDLLDAMKRKVSRESYAEGYEQAAINFSKQNSPHK